MPLQHLSATRSGRRERGRRSLEAYFGSYGLSLLGNGIAGVVLPLLVLERTGSVLAAGLVATVGTAGSVVIGLFAGLIVDRSNRRTLSIVADLLSAGSVVALIVIDAMWGLSLPWFVVLAGVGALIDVPGETAREVILPALARVRPSSRLPLDRLIATRESIAGVMVLAGPGVGGLLVWLVGLNASLLVITAATSAGAALLTLAVDPAVGWPDRGAARGVQRGLVRVALQDLAAGWRFLATTPIVLASTLLSVALVAILAPMQAALIPAFFAAERLPALTGIVVSALAAGSILGSVIYATCAKRLSRRIWLVLALVGTALGFVAVGSLASPVVVLAGAALIGTALTPAGTILGILTIEATPDPIRGRVLAAQNVLSHGVIASVVTPIAALAAATTLQTAGLLLAGIFVIVAVVALRSTTLRDLEPPRSSADTTSESSPS